MEPACGGYISGPPRNQIPPLVGQDDLFEVLQVELGHVDLIRNILPMHCRIGRSNLHQNIPWRWPYKSILKLGHNDLFKDLACED